MGKEKDISKNRELVKQNLNSILGGATQVESDGELLHKSDTSNLSEHNKQYTELLKAYVEDFKENSKNKRKNKEKLFKIAKLLLFFIPTTTIILMFVILFCLANNKVSILDAIPELIVALTTLLGTFMTIPKMITKYLFNKDEEEHLAKIIGKIQKYDRDIREDL